MTAINGSTAMPQQAFMPTPTNGIMVPGGTDPGTLVPGVTVTTPGGSTTLPNASVSDYSKPQAPGDAPDQQYPSLVAAHVAVFRAIGTPEEVIAQLAAENPDVAVVDDYIVSQIFQNPEGWDAHVGNQPGTARAGLAQLMPGQFGDPTAQQTSSQTLPDGGNVVTTPGATFSPAPMGGMSPLVKGGLVAAGVGIPGFFIWRHFHNKKAAGAAAADAGAAEMSKLLGGAPVRGGGDAAAHDALLALSHNRGRFGLQGLNAFGMRGASLDDVSAMRLMSAMNTEIDHPAINLARAGLLQTDVAAALETAKLYKVKPETMLKYTVLSNTVGNLESKHAAKVLTAMMNDSGATAAKGAEALSAKQLGKLVQSKGLEEIVTKFDAGALLQAAEQLAKRV